LVGAIQHALSELGHDPGRIDGTLGDKTRQAIRRFQREAGMPQTGLPSEELLEALTAKLDKTPKATAVR
jgi:peptidoglycan hydrolase-like protein with peptidoglycan-binding domain